MSEADANTILEYLNKQPFSAERPYTALRPKGGRHTLPILNDSPHSSLKGIDEAVRSAQSRAFMRGAADLYTDTLLIRTLVQGASFLRAEFGRSIVDVNKPPDSLNADDIPDYTGKITTSEKPSGMAGRGTMWLRRPDGQPLYDPLPGEDTLRQRLHAFYAPYHAYVGAFLDNAVSNHGVAYYVDWHSCLRAPGELRRFTRDELRADFILSDRNGQTCTSSLRNAVAEWIEARGYSVAVNTPFIGGELVKKFGNPPENKHALQIEICRDLYMDEQSLRPHDGFKRIQDLIADLHSEILIPTAAAGRDSDFNSCSARTSRGYQRPHPRIAQGQHPGPAS